MQQLQTEKLEPIELPQLPESPLVSVIIANYNYAKYVGEAIDSVLSQTYSNFEIIVCDDGSSDNSCEVIETYVQKDSRIKVVRQQNGGVASALNTAYRETKGQIICLLDADDVWKQDKLQKTIAAFRANSKAGFAIHNVREVDSSGQPLKQTPLFKNLPSGWLGTFALENGGFTYNIPPASAISLRREASELLFPLNEEFARNADGLITQTIAFVTEITTVPEELNLFRIHGANLTSGSSGYTAAFLEREINLWLRIHQEQKQFLEKLYGSEVAQSLTGLESSLKYLHYRYLLTRLKRCGKSETRKAHQQLTAHPQFGRHSVPERWILPWAEYLPDVLFAKMFNFVYGASEFKAFLKQILGGLVSPRYVLR